MGAWDKDRSGLKVRAQVDSAFWHQLKIDGYLRAVFGSCIADAIPEEDKRDLVCVRSAVLCIVH
jgi:hypothetical protein